MNFTMPSYSACSFCGRGADEAGFLLPGLSCSICESCVEQSALFPTNTQAAACCGVCGRKQRQVSKLLTKNDVNICNVCIEELLHPSVLTHRGWLIDPRKRFGAWLLNSKNPLVRKLVDG